jgi:hypothetical protein
MSRSESSLVRFVAPALSFAALLSSSDCFAEPFGGVEFPLGARSFADSVVSFDLHDATDVAAPYDDPKAALGTPDYSVADDTGYVSLGNTPDNGTPSELVLRFDDNALVDVPGDDLYVFEIGPQVEATEVAVSPDGKTWYDLGRIEGSTRGIDLSVFSSIPKVEMRFVRLRDYPDGSTSPSPYGGPDIDAVGAIGSVAAAPLDAGADGSIVDAGTPPSDAATGADGASPGDASGSGGSSAIGAGGSGGTAGGAGKGGAGTGASAGGTAKGGSGTEADGSAAPCSPTVHEVTKCECSVPGRVQGAATAPLIAAAAAILLAGKRRRSRRSA